MTIWLLDENVLRELRPGGNARAASDQVESLHPVMARLDRAIGINAAERAMARSGRAMTGLHVNLVGNRSNVQAWYATVPIACLRISAMTFFEKRRGAERLRKTDPGRAARLLAAIDAVEAAYRFRIIPIDGPVAAEWTRLLGA